MGVIPDNTNSEIPTAVGTPRVAPGQKPPITNLSASPLFTFASKGDQLELTFGEQDLTSHNEDPLCPLHPQSPSIMQRTNSSRSFAGSSITAPTNRVPQSSEFDFNTEQLQAALMGRVVNYDNTETRNMSNHITALYATWYHLSQKSPFSVLFKTLSKVKAAMKDILATYSRNLPAFMEHVSLLTDHLRSLVQSCKNLMGANNSFTFNLMAAKADSDIESLVSSNTEQQSLEHSDQVKQITCLLPNIAHLAGLTDEELDRRAYTLLPTTTCLEGHFLARRSAPLLDSLELSQSIQTVAALTSQGLSPGSSRPTSGVTSPDPEEKLDHLSPLKLVPLFSDYRHPPALKIEK